MLPMKSLISTIIMIFIFTELFCQSDDEFFTPSASIGGYGELHYNYKKLDMEKPSKILDFHRFVVFFGYDFGPKWSFRSEVELEHNLVEGNSGELELEQAYINYNPAQYFGIRAGVVLNSVGLLNEVHEPTTFFGVERPEYQRIIIPTTWFGNGMAIFGLYNGFDYVLTFMEGLNADELTEENITKDGIRSARRKGFKSNAGSMLLNGRINYTGISGLIVGGSYTYNNAVGDSLHNKVSIAELHMRLNINALYFTGEIGKINYSEGNIQSSFGFYTDVGYDFGYLLGWDLKIIPFIRFSNYNTLNSLIINDNSVNNKAKYRILTGINFLPIDQVVLKADLGIEKQKNENKKTHLFNLGIGYFF